MRQRRSAAVIGAVANPRMRGRSRDGDLYSVEPAWRRPPAPAPVYVPPTVAGGNAGSVVGLRGVGDGGPSAFGGLALPCERPRVAARRTA